MEYNAKKIIVAHPGQQHSFKDAEALKKAGMLCKFVTSIYYKPNSCLMRSVRKIGGEREEQKKKTVDVKALKMMRLSHITLFIPCCNCA